MEYGFKKELYPTQKQFIQDATKIVENGGVGIFSSPTGTGKTMSLLCTAISVIGKESEDDLFSLLSTTSRTEIYYCSRTHSQLSQVINELKTNENKYKSVILGSRKVYCVNESVNKLTSTDLINEKCRCLVKEEECRFYENPFYTEDTLDIEDLKNRCKDNNSCPYYYAKNKASDCKIVFLPYNLLFTKEGRSSCEINLEGKILIIDEAHNIYDTIIQLNSAEISWIDIKRISNIKNLSEDLKAILERLLVFSNSVKEERAMNVTDFIVQAKIAKFNMFEIEEYILENKIAQKNEMPTIFELSKLLRLLTFSDDNGIVILSKSKVRFTPLDPKIYFKELLKCKSVIFAGGTMEPISQLQTVFPHLQYFSYPSVNNNFLPIVITETPSHKIINFTFEERDALIEDVINTLIALSNPISSGGVLIFVPSTAILSKIKSSKKAEFFRRRVYYEDEISFEKYKDDPSILIAVMNGKLSEGINFSDDLCRLLIVVGVPFPSKSVEIDERCKFNREYGTITAMKSVNQALGRALRHKDDYAALVLLDARYTKLKEMLSPWIKSKTICSSFINGLLEINKFIKSRT